MWPNRQNLRENPCVLLPLTTATLYKLGRIIQGLLCIGSEFMQNKTGSLWLFTPQSSPPMSQQAPFHTGAESSNNLRGLEFWFFGLFFFFWRGRVGEGKKGDRHLSYKSQYNRFSRQSCPDIPPLSEVCRLCFAKHVEELKSSYKLTV